MRTISIVLQGIFVACVFIAYASTAFQAVDEKSLFEFRVIAILTFIFWNITFDYFEKKGKQ